jgi:hypothetical protein
MKIAFSYIYFLIAEPKARAIFARAFGIYPVS